MFNMEVNGRIHSNSNATGRENRSHHEHVIKHFHKWKLSSLPPPENYSNHRHHHSKDKQY